MLTLAEAREMVDEILLSDPNRRFGALLADRRGYPEVIEQGEECRYFAGDEGEEAETPCCVIGHVLVRIGLTRRDLMLSDNVLSPNTARFDLLEYTWGRKIEYQAAKFLSEVQREQDNGITWREVYDKLHATDGRHINEAAS